MEEILQNGIWKNCLPFHSMLCQLEKIVGRSGLSSQTLRAWDSNPRFLLSDMIDVFITLKMVDFNQIINERSRDSLKIFVKSLRISQLVIFGEFPG